VYGVGCKVTRRMVTAHRVIHVMRRGIAMSVCT
jgi:hypothetical protein